MRTVVLYSRVAAVVMLAAPTSASTIATSDSLSAAASGCSLSRVALDGRVLAGVALDLRVEEPRERRPVTAAFAIDGEWERTENYLKLHGLDKREIAEAYHLNAAQWGEFPSTGRFVQRAYREYGDVTHAYLPTSKELSAAGWQPIPLASGARVERFGERGAVYFTVRGAPRTRATLAGTIPAQSSTESQPPRIATGHNRLGRPRTTRSPTGSRSICPSHAPYGRSGSTGPSTAGAPTRRSGTPSSA